jgi:16S rRNA processing protein RimM
MTSRRRQAAARRRQKNEKAGSPPLVGPAFLLVGILRRPHGVKGEVLMAVMTDFPERLKPGITLYLGSDHQPVTIANVRHHNKGLIVAFEEFQSRTDLDHLRNQELFVRVDDRPALPDGQYYLHQLIGLQAVTEDGQNLGIIAEWIETGANGVFVVKPEDGGEILIPDIDEVIVGIDLKNGQINIRLIEGLLPD